MAKSNRIDKKQLQILVDTTKGVDQLGYLQEMYKRLGEEAKRTESAMTSRALLRQQDEIRDKMQDLRDELGLQGMTVNQLRQYYRELQREHSTSSGQMRQQAKQNMIAVQQQLDAMHAGLGRTERAQSAMNKSIAEQIKLTGVAGLSLDQLEAHYQQLTAQVTALTAAELRQNKALMQQREEVGRLVQARRQRIGDSTSILNTMQAYLPGGGSALANLGPYGAGAAALVYGAKAVADIEETYSNALVPLRNLIESQAQYNEAIQFLNLLADSTGQKFTVLASSYKNIYATGTQAGYSASQINQIFKGLIDTGATLRLKNEQIELSLKAIEQMMNKGTISSEELRQQLGDHIPGAYAIMAKAAKDAGISTSGTTEELSKLLEEGKLASDVVLPAFISRLQEAFGKNPQANLETMAGSANRLSNELQQLVQDMDAGRAQRFFAAINNGVADVIKKFRETPWLQRVAGGFVEGVGNQLSGGMVSAAKLFYRYISFGYGMADEKRKAAEAAAAEASKPYVDPLYQEQFDFTKWKPSNTPVKTETAEEKAARERAQKEAEQRAEAARKQQEALVAARIKNEAEATSKIFQNNIAAIEDEATRKKAAIYAAADRQEEADRELLNKKEISIEKFNELQVSNQAEVSRQIAEIDSQIAEKSEKEKLQIQRNMKLMTMQQAIDIAREQEDFDTAYLIEQEKLRHQFEIDMAEATAEKKAEIELKFQIERDALARKYSRDNEEWWFQYFSEQRDKEIAVDKAAKDKKDEQDKEAKEKKQARDEALVDLAYATEEAVYDIFAGRLQAQEQALAANHSRELEALEARNRSGQISDEKYKSLKLQLEKKQARELAEIQRKQAIMEKAAALTQITINTAVAATKAAAQTGVGAAVAVPLIIAAGAVQAAAVAAKPLPQVPSYMMGKPANTGPWRGTADAAGGHLAIVHPNEEIVPAAVTATPAFAAVKPLLDSMRSGTYAQPRDTQQKAGKSAGNNLDGLPGMLQKLDDTVSRLEGRLSDLRVYFGGSDTERLAELLQELQTENEESLI